MIPIALPLAKAADTLSKPAVTFPANWSLKTDNPYPTEDSEHDPAGAGLLECTDQNTYDLVMIYYEKAPSTSYTASTLKAEAESIFLRDDNENIIDSGSKQYAGVTAGYAKGYDSSVDVYLLELVFVKGSYYFNVYAYYDANAQAENKVTSLINSIDVSGTSQLGGSNLFIIIGAIAAIIVIVVVVVLVMRKKRKQPQQAAAAPQYSYPPPPQPTA